MVACQMHQSRRTVKSVNNPIYDKAFYRDLIVKITYKCIESKSRMEHFHCLLAFY